MTGLKTTSLLKRFRTASAGVCAALAVSVASFSASVAAQAPAVGWPEKEELKFGFIKLTDMAPLAVAYEKGFFEDEGLYVTLEAQANWKVLLDRVIDGHDSTVKAMNELTKQMGNASEGIKDLDEQSQKVADLVKSISGIADQTNLLALNAAIEAARAGDQGRGFAVVADEVRQLASRTSSATEEIVNVVVENRKLTENAVQLIEAGQEKAREALEYSTQSGKAMSEIQSGANEVVNAIGQFTKRL